MNTWNTILLCNLTYNRFSASPFSVTSTKVQLITHSRGSQLATKDSDATHRDTDSMTFRLEGPSPAMAIGYIYWVAMNRTRDPRLHNSAPAHDCEFSLCPCGSPGATGEAGSGSSPAVESGHPGISWCSLRLVCLEYKLQDIIYNKEHWSSKASKVLLLGDVPVWSRSLRGDWTTGTGDSNQPP